MKADEQAAAENAARSITEAILDGSLLRMTKVRGENKAKCYITLRQWGLGKWATHYYNASLDSFEFGRYHTDLNRANTDFDKRVAEYKAIDDRTLFNI